MGLSIYLSIYLSISICLYVFFSSPALLLSLDDVASFRPRARRACFSLLETLSLLFLRTLYVLTFKLARTNEATEEEESEKKRKKRATPPRDISSPLLEPPPSSSFSSSHPHPHPFFPNHHLSYSNQPYAPPASMSLPLLLKLFRPDEVVKLTVDSLTFLAGKADNERERVVVGIVANVDSGVEEGA